MAELGLEQVIDELASLRGRVARQEAELARYRRRRSRPFLPFLVVGLLAALAPLAVLAANPFTDLTGGVHDPNIDAITTAGITTGCDPTHYCPTANVTREEMASFIARLGGLGTNPPVANARVVQGYAPSGLVRAARGRQETNFTSLPHGGFDAPPVVLASLTLDAPGPGFALLSGSFSASREVGTGFARIEYRLRDATGGESSPPLDFALGPAANGLTGSTATVLAVPAAGPRSYILEVRNAGFDTNAFGSGGEIVALFVPFGSTGGSTLDAP